MTGGNLPIPPIFTPVQPPSTKYVTRRELVRLYAEASQPGTSSERLLQIVRMVARGRPTRHQPGASPAREALIHDLQASWGRIREAVTAHPNTPLEILAQFSIQHPAAFCRNPATPLLPLEDPGFLRRIPLEGRHRLLRYENAPEWLVSLSATPPENASVVELGLSQEARMHVRFAGEAGENWPREFRALLRDLAAQAAETPRQHFTLAEMAGTGIAPIWVRESVGTTWPGADVPVDYFVEDAADYAADLRDAATADTTAVRLEELTEHVSWDVRLAVASNPATPASSLRRLMKSNFMGMFKLKVAAHPNATEDILEQLARSQNPWVRRAVWNNPGTNEHIRSICRKTTAEIVLRLSIGIGAANGFFAALYVAPENRNPDSPLWWYRLAACLVPATSPADRERFPALLEPLTQDGNRYVRAAACYRIANPDAPCPVTDGDEFQR